MEQQLIKTLLCNSTFLANQANLRRTLFSGEYASIYDKLKEAHEKYARDLTLDEIYSLWLTDNPVATPAEIHEVRDVIDELKRVEALGEDGEAHGERDGEAHGVRDGEAHHEPGW